MSWRRLSSWIMNKSSSAAARVAPSYSNRRVPRQMSVRLVCAKMSNSFSSTRTLSMASWIALTRAGNSGICCCTSGRGQP
eukprot:165516-Alexandrium_andersonii.AAC.1